MNHADTMMLRFAIVFPITLVLAAILGWNLAESRRVISAIVGALAIAGLIWSLMLIARI